jgi:hypothetical protein
MNILKVFLFLAVSKAFSIHAQEDTLNVLFIGNSITYFNDMPQLFESIAENQGHQMHVTTYAPGGTGFVNHYVDPQVFQLFRNEVWDIVVLQPGSGESAGASYPVDTTAKRGQVLLDSLYAYSPCARVYLYQIPYGVISPPDYSNYFSVQTMIKNVVSELADSLEVQIIPAGEAAREYYTLHQNLLLHNAYGDIHPSLAGSFLTASTAYATIFQDSVSDCTYYSTLVQDTVTQFFSIAENKVLNQLVDWRINTYNLHSDFSVALNANTAVFTSHAANSSNLLWDFGDGTTSTEINPTRTFNDLGLYTVTLFVYNANGCIDSSAKVVLLSSAMLQEKSAVNGLIVFPNPATDFIDFSSEQLIRGVRIFNLAGDIVIATDEKHVYLEDIVSGLYIAEIQFNDHAIRVSIAKN